jgi:hypothetical protein
MRSCRSSSASWKRLSSVSPIVDWRATWCIPWAIESAILHDIVQTLPHELVPAVTGSPAGVTPLREGSMTVRNENTKLLMVVDREPGRMEAKASMRLRCANISSDFDVRGVWHLI